MYTFPLLLKEIRKNACLTQADLANALGVSVVLIAMVESEQKEASKKLMVKLAELMEVHPASITPFLFIQDKDSFEKRSALEKKLIDFGEGLQIQLIQKGSKKLQKYASKK